MFVADWDTGGDSYAAPEETEDVCEQEGVGVGFYVDVEVGEGEHPGYAAAAGEEEGGECPAFTEGVES